MKKNLRIEAEDIKVVDGRVVITSEELAEAIQNQSLELGDAEVDDEANSVNFWCVVER